jgi:glycerophosphoryl diester phosphodiesterase
LEDLFQISEGKYISIDLKDPHDQNDILKEEVGKLIKKYNREDLTIIGAMSNKSHKAIRKINPTTPTFFSAVGVIMTYVWFYTGLLWLIPISDDAFMVPLLTQEKCSIVTKMRSANGKPSLSLRLILFMARFILWNQGNLFRHLRARGILVVVWVFNEESEWEEALAIGNIDGMMTDKPSYLANFC